MDRKKITAYLINCNPDEFMAYADQEDLGTVVVGPDGKKFRFSNDQLDQAVIRKREKDRAAAAAKPKPAPKKRAPAKQSTSGTKTKAKAKPKQSKNSPAR